MAAVVALILCGTIVYRQGKAFAVKRGLTAEYRHVVVDALAAASLVSPDEAAELHRRVGERANDRA